MKWNHLPLPGGLYDQHPQFIDEIEVIFREKNQYDRQQAEKRRTKSKTPRRPTSRLR